ncbi:MAG TPA: type II/IV secretion system ATPase subunit, partial [Methanomassiliicoccaceae archaeon]|nr:type II/IV secretion system ATPase subunit [Methanomassiliicoccaceae archaeon]
MPEDDVLRSSEESPDDVSTKAGRQHAPPQPLEGRSPRDRSGHGNHDEPIIDIEHIVSNGAGTVELSVIEEGRSYARITYDDATAEHMYEVVEPRLNEDELAAFELLKKALIISLNAPSDPSPEHRRKMLDKAVDRLTSTLGLTLRPVSRERILYHLHRDFIGYGPITVMMADPDIEDISCNGVGVPLFVYHRKYGSIRTNVIYEDEAELDRYVIWLAQRCGKHISLARPMLDATIPDGSRLNATLGRHVTKRGSSFTIRRFKDDPFTPVDLIGFNTMSTEMMAYLWISVEFGSSMMVCGGTASGKTS